MAAQHCRSWSPIHFREAEVNHSTHICIYCLPTWNSSGPASINLAPLPTSDPRASALQTQPPNLPDPPICSAGISENQGASPRGRPEQPCYLCTSSDVWKSTATNVCATELYPISEFHHNKTTNMQKCCLQLQSINARSQIICQFSLRDLAFHMKTSYA